MAKKDKVKKWIETEFLLLNYMLGGGIPSGKIIEIFGFEGCGKTTLAMELSKYFKSVYYIDYEHELDHDYADSIGVKLAEYTQPTYFEQGVDEFFKALKKKKYDLLIIDTIGSAITKEQLEKDIEDNTVGSLANRVTLFLRKAEAILKPLGVTVILLNHKKDKIGGGFGEKHYTTGGRQILFSSSIRLSVTRKKATIFTEPEESIISNIWTVKNKLINKPTVRNCMYHIIRGKGISRGEECLRLGIQTEMITTKGQMFYIGSKSFRGKRNIVEFLDDHKEIRDKLNEKWIELNTD